MRAPAGLLPLTIRIEWERAVIPAGVVGPVGAVISEHVELGFHGAASIEGETVHRLVAPVYYHVEVGVVGGDSPLGTWLLRGGGDGQKRKREDDEISGEGMGACH